MNEKEKHYFKLLLPVALLGIALFIWYIFSESVSDNGIGSDAVRAELNGAGELIDSSIELAGIAEERIAGVEDAIRDSIERVDRIEERNSEIEDKLTTSLRLNRESQSIIQGIRERSQEDSEKIN